MKRPWTDLRDLPLARELSVDDEQREQA